MASAVALGRGRRAVAEVGASIAVERLLGFVASGAFCVVALLFAIRADLELTILLPWTVTAIAAAVAVLVLPSNRWAAARLAR